ncbi:MAG: hypothetical protein PVF83_09760 [Anaerolineales bacterium]
MGQLSKLPKLSLADNNLTALPPEIQNLSQLRALHLKGNPLPMPQAVLEKTNPQKLLKT